MKMTTDPKEKLETAINALIWNFEKDTGLEVVAIVRTVQHKGGGKVLRINRIVKVKTRKPKNENS